MGRKEIIINRELSWLAFNARVLQEAADPSVPLVERIRFLGIFSNNRDEFFRVRVATVKRLVDLDSKKVRQVIGDTPKTVLKKIQQTVIRQQREFEAIYKEILKELERKDIYIINEKELDTRQGEFVRKYFHEKVYPTLVPIMIHQIKKFPFLGDRSIYLAVLLSQKGVDSEEQAALIEVPTTHLSRFVVLPTTGGKRYVILLDDVIRFCLDDIFSIFDYDRVDSYMLKITRDAELDIDNDISASFLEKMRKSLKQRKKGVPVRFVYDKKMPPKLLKFIIKRMKIDAEDNLIPGGRYHNFKDFMGFPDLGQKALRHRSAPPLRHPEIQPGQSIIQMMRKKDFLLFYPYQTFVHFIDLLREASIDPKVKSIQITLYRVASRSQVVNALINAAKNGKKVTVVVELQARFDEEANIYWSNMLQEEGVDVVFGVPGLKVHSKVCLITRIENGKQVRYATIGTGNFNENTARIYSDISLFTSDKRITTEAERVFGIFLNVYRPNYYYKHLVLSPVSFRNRLVRLINSEIKYAKAGNEASIFLKLNSLVDPDLVSKLYEAGKAGVKIRLIIRGICSLVPGVDGMSENIEAISIVDKYLEHARIYWFGHSGKDLMFISSADGMSRNLDSRIEVTCPIYDTDLKQEIVDILEIQWRDNAKARILNKEQDNSYRQLTGKKVRAQLELYNYYQKKGPSRS